MLTQKPLYSFLSVLIFYLSTITIGLAQSLETLPQPSLSSRDSVYQFYNCHQPHLFVIETFDRVQVPLDGKTAKMIPFRKDELYGFVSKDDPDTWLIEPKYKEVHAVYGDQAIVKIGYPEGRGYGLIDQKGKWLIEPTHQNLFKTTHGFRGASSLYDIVNGGGEEIDTRIISNHYFDSKGKLLFEELAHDQQDFTKEDTVAWFRNGFNYTVRGISGKILLQRTLSSHSKLVGAGNDHFILLETQANKTIRCAIYNYQQELQHSFKLQEKYVDYVYQLSDQLYGLEQEGYFYSFCNAQGLTLPYNAGLSIDEIGSEAFPKHFFDQAYFRVRHEESELMGLMDRSGKMLVAAEYIEIGPFINGEALAVVDSEGYAAHLSVINKKGKVLNKRPLASPAGAERLQRELFEELKFSDGWSIDVSPVIDSIVVEDGDSIYHVNAKLEYFYFFDKTGKQQLRLSPDIILVSHFSDGLAAAVNKDKKLGFINKKGVWAIAPQYEVQVIGDYPIFKVSLPTFKGGFAYLKAYKGYIDTKGKVYFSGKQVKDRYQQSH